MKEISPAQMLESIDEIRANLRALLDGLDALQASDEVYESLVETLTALSDFQHHFEQELLKAESEDGIGIEQSLLRKLQLRNEQ